MHLWDITKKKGLSPAFFLRTLQLRTSQQLRFWFLYPISITGIEITIFKVVELAFLTFPKAVPITNSKRRTDPPAVDFSSLNSPYHTLVTVIPVTKLWYGEFKEGKWRARAITVQWATFLKLKVSIKIIKQPHTDRSLIEQAQSMYRCQLPRFHFSRDPKITFEWSALYRGTRVAHVLDLSPTEQWKSTYY